MGVYSGGRFYLIVSLDFVPTDAEVLHLRKLFQQASDILFGATEGHHAIGKVFYAENLGAEVADIRIFDGLSAGSDSFDANLWSPGKYVTLYRGNLADVVGGRAFVELLGDLFDATLIVHELGHYLYGVLDEYIGLTYRCVDDPSATPTTCLMELYPTQYHSLWDVAASAFGPGGPSQFCWGDVSAGGDHDTATPTFQNAQVDDLMRTELSCWSWMAHDPNHDNIPYGLVEPAAGPTAPASAPPILDPLVVLTPVERFGLVLDRSGSMLGAKFAGLKTAAYAFIDLLTAGQEFASNSFSETATVASSLDTVPAGTLSTWRSDQQHLVDILNPAGTTAIGDALDLGRRQLSSADVAAVQSLILMTDGRENAGALTIEQAIPDLVAKNVRGFPIGFGNDVDEASLENLATQTGGEYLQLAESLTPEQIADEIPQVMLYASGTIPEDSMVTAFASIYEGYSLDPESLPFAWGGIPDPPAVPSGPPAVELSYPIEISAGSRGCTLGCYWSRLGARFDLELIRPDGAQATDNEISRSVRGPRPYAFHVLERPMPGTWRLRIRGQEIRGTRFRVFGFQSHPNLRLETSVERAIVHPGDDVEIRVSVRIPQRVPGLTVRARILSPTGKWSRADLLERSAEQPEAGIYVARISTIPHQTGSYLVCIDASRRAGRETFRPWPASRLEVGRPPRASDVAIPSLRLRKLVSFVADDSGRYERRSLHGSNSKPLSVPADQAARVQEWKDRHRRR